MLGTRILEERKSKYNGNLRVVRSWGMGTYIQAGGLTQSGGIVGTIWKPTLQKLRTKNVEIKTCLILGLGAGTAAKYIRLFWPQAKITGVDVDPVIVDLGRKYLGLDEVKIDIKIRDAYDFAPAYGWDLIIVDLYNGDKFPEKFETEKFLRKLIKNKIVVFNRLYYKGKKEEAEKFGEKLQKHFSEVEYFRPDANMMFICTP